MVSVQLSAIYTALGITDPQKRQALVHAAIDYLGADREHYILTSSYADPDAFDLDDEGMICRIVPLARKITTDQTEDYDIVRSSILCLAVHGNSCQCLLRLSEKNSYKHYKTDAYFVTHYHPVQLRELSCDMECLPPHEIIPPATPQDRQVFGMVFTALATFNTRTPLSLVCHKTEQILAELGQLAQTEVTIKGQKISGKLIPLASEMQSHVQHQKKRSSSTSRAILLLVAEDTEKYVLMTNTVFEYYKEDTDDEVHCEPYRTRRQTKYSYVDLSDIDFTVYPHYGSL